MVCRLVCGLALPSVLLVASDTGSSTLWRSLWALLLAVTRALLPVPVASLVGLVFEPNKQAQQIAWSRRPLWAHNPVGPV